MMLVLEEIGIEVLMIVAVLTAAACLGYLLLLTVLEQVYLARLRRGRAVASSTIVRNQDDRRHRAPAVWRQKRA